MAALIDALGRAAEDQAARVVVIAGAGPGVLRRPRSARDARRPPAREPTSALFAQCSELMLAIVRLPKPVIAEVHGVATAAGCQLVASCDLAVAAEDARFATPGVNIGLFCSTPMVALSRAVGRKAAMEMLLTGELIDAARAREIGPRQPRRAERRIARGGRCAGPRRSPANRPLTVGDRQGGVLPPGRARPRRRLRLCRRGDDHATCWRADAGEGIDAFLAKRAPVWQDR